MTFFHFVLQHNEFKKEKNKLKPYLQLIISAGSQQKDSAQQPSLLHH